MEPPNGDEVIEAIDQLITELKQNVERLHLALSRASVIKELRRAGSSFSEIAETAQGPLLVDLLTINLLVLQRAGHKLRRAEARALRDEGKSVEQIARIFGVSRQRISQILHEEQQG